jgi:hypothetical protein
MAMNGHAAEAVLEFERQRARDDTPRSRCELAWAYALAGRPGDAAHELERARHMSAPTYPYDEALVLAALDRRDDLFEALGRAFDSRDSTLVNLKHDPRFDGVRSDPRYAKLLALMRFP